MVETNADGSSNLTVPDELDFDFDSMEMPEETDEEDESSKRAAAFGKLRKAGAAFKDLATKQGEEIERLRNELQTARSQATRVEPGEHAVQMQKYRESLRQRATDEVRKLGIRDPAEANQAFWETMSVLAAQDAAAAAAVQAREPIAEQIQSSVFSQFGVLNEEDKQELRDVLGKLPSDIRTNPETVRREIEAFIGRNIDRFTSRESEDQETERTEKKPKETLKGSSTGKVRLADMDAATATAAAASSNLKAGSGVRLTEHGAGTPPTVPPKLDEEDIRAMRLSGLDPSNKEDVQLHVRGKKRAVEMQRA